MALIIEYFQTFPILSKKVPLPTNDIIYSILSPDNLKSLKKNQTRL